MHAIIDKKVAAGVPTKNIFVCGFSQGGNGVANYLMGFMIMIYSERPWNF